MEDLDIELERAREELKFWQDFATWDARRRSSDFDERVSQALNRAEARYLAVKTIVEQRDADSKPVRRSGTLH